MMNSTDIKKGEDSQIVLSINTYIYIYILLFYTYSCVWDLEAGKREMEFDAHAGDVVTISLAPGKMKLQIKLNY